MKGDPPVFLDHSNLCLAMETYKVRFSLYANGFLRISRLVGPSRCRIIIAEASQEQWEKEQWKCFGVAYWNDLPGLYDHIAQTVYRFPK